MLTTHVVSQGLAEEMKKAGWPQEGSTFYWLRQRKSEWILVQYWMLETYVDETGHTHFSTRGDTEVIAVPLASELLERMPHGIAVFKKPLGDYAAECNDREEGYINESAETASDALAKLALHLIKEGILKA